MKRNLSWARMVTWACYWWPDRFGSIVGVAHFLDKVGKSNGSRSIFNPDYCVWWVLCAAIQMTFQALDKMYGCLHVLRVDENGSVFQYLIHELIIVCSCWMRNLIVWSDVRFDPQRLVCVCQASRGRLVWLVRVVSRVVSIVWCVHDGSYDSSDVPPDSVVVSCDDVLLDATSVQNCLCPCSHYCCSSSGRHKSSCL